MTQDEIIKMANQAELCQSIWIDDEGPEISSLIAFAKLVAAKQREALEVELLKLKQGVAANSDYIQGRWDLIGEFQDP